MCRYLVLLCVAVLLFPADAFAWGPGVHLATASWLLDQLSLLPALTGAALAAHPEAFLYGTLAPDIFIGKGCSVRPGHSHNWATAHALLDETEQASPRLQAFAAGYLAHLAADTVAHNHYVPTLLAALPGSGKLSHVYIEMQADRMVAWDTPTARRLFRGRHRDADAALLRAMRKRNLPFLLKKQLFRSSVALSGGHMLRHSLQWAGQLAPAVADKNYLEAMLDVSLRAVVDVLCAPRDSDLLGIDPIGSGPLREAKLTGGRELPLAMLIGAPRLVPLDSRLEALPPLCGQGTTAPAGIAGGCQKD